MVSGYGLFGSSVGYAGVGDVAVVGLALLRGLANLPVSGATIGSRMIGAPLAVSADGVTGAAAGVAATGGAGAGRSIVPPTVKYDEATPDPSTGPPVLDG